MLPHSGPIILNDPVHHVLTPEEAAWEARHALRYALYHKQKDSPPACPECGRVMVPQGYGDALYDQGWWCEDECGYLTFEEVEAARAGHCAT